MSSPVLVASNIRELLPMKRLPGYHVSTIVNALAVRLGHLEEREPGDRPPQIMLEMGSAWEDVMSDYLSRRYALDQPDRYVHGVSLQLDELSGNCDLLDLQDYVIEEIKLTAMSLKRAEDPDNPKFWKYWTQLKCYCKMAGTTTGRLHVCFYRGDYKQILVGYRCWEWTWDQREIDNTWRLVSTNRHLGIVEAGQ